MIKKNTWSSTIILRFARYMAKLTSHDKGKFYPPYVHAQSSFHYDSSRATNWTMDFDSDQAAASLHVTFRLWHQCVEPKTDQNTKPNYLSTPQETLPCWFFFQGLGSWVVDRRHCFFINNKVTKQEPYWWGIMLWMSLSQARERGSDACQDKPL